VQGLRTTPEHRTAWARIRRLVGLLFLDAALVAAVVIAASLSALGVERWLARIAGLGPWPARFALVAAAVGLLLPFVFGAVRIARALGVALAAEALPTPTAEGGLDLAAAPRRALLVTLQLAILLVAGVPVVAVTQPFLPGVEGMGILLVGVALLAVPLWRSASNLQGHVRAGAQVILEALASQSGSASPGGPEAAGAAPEKVLPGLGNARAVRLGAASTAVGRTLRELDLRGLTGATVIAIDREPEDVVYPTAEETLRAGDTLVLTGTTAAVEAARELLGERGQA
jgi:CPA2 family monovalent cation:H+ antiporter-2